MTVSTIDNTFLKMTEKSSHQRKTNSEDEVGIFRNWFGRCGGS